MLLLLLVQKGLQLKQQKTKRGLSPNSKQNRNEKENKEEAAARVSKEGKKEEEGSVKDGEGNVDNCIHQE